MNNILLSKNIAKALQLGFTVLDIANATGLTKTEVLNMADNANLSNRTGVENMEAPIYNWTTGQGEKF